VVREQAFVARAEGDAAKTKLAFETTLRLWESDMPNKKPDDPGMLSAMAQLHAGLGQKDEAFREARRAVEVRPIAADAVARLSPPSKHSYTLGSESVISR
jgi:Flp pilus assembly protein TadD